jgi:hypothetical protein
LVEDREVGGVDLVAAVGGTRSDDADRWQPDRCEQGSRVRQRRILICKMAWLRFAAGPGFSPTCKGESR